MKTAVATKINTGQYERVGRNVDKSTFLQSETICNPPENIIASRLIPLIVNTCYFSGNEGDMHKILLFSRIDSHHTIHLLQAYVN